MAASSTASKRLCCAKNATSCLFAFWGTLATFTWVEFQMLSKAFVCWRKKNSIVNGSPGCLVPGLQLALAQWTRNHVETAPMFSIQAKKQPPNRSLWPVWHHKNCRTCNQKRFAWQSKLCKLCRHRGPSIGLEVHMVPYDTQHCKEFSSRNWNQEVVNLSRLLGLSCVRSASMSPSKLLFSLLASDAFMSFSCFNNQVTSSYVSYLEPETAFIADEVKKQPNHMPSEKISANMLQIFLSMSCTFTAEGLLAHHTFSSIPSFESAHFFWANWTPRKASWGKRKDVSGGKSITFADWKLWQWDWLPCLCCLCLVSVFHLFGHENDLWLRRGGSIPLRVVAVHLLRRTHNLKLLGFNWHAESLSFWVKQICFVSRAANCLFKRNTQT